ncbi:hypothetical protein DRP05_09120 [Archaeoglobales archaeon]|nr:MAG: hypothetical protein DRP05_09120 [Archaeoglobales archaeon]
MNWYVKEKDFPEKDSMEDKLKFLINYAVLAPSSHNTQPWKFSIKGNNIEIYVDFTRQLHEVDPEKRELYISVGCAISNLLLAAEHFGFGYKLKYFTGEEGELVAIIELYPDKRETDLELFSQIFLRQTNRGEYEPKEIEGEKLQKLKACVDDLRLDLITDQKTKSEIAKLISLAHKIQLSNKAFRKELASWPRHNWSKAGDGMAGYAFSIPSIMSLFGSFFIRTFDISKSQAKKDEELANKAPIIGILSSTEDGKLSWVKVGVTFEKVMLMATKLNLSIAFFNQPIEVPELRKELRTLLGIAEFPQLMFRIGYTKPTKYTPRRRLEEVIV